MMLASHVRIWIDLRKNFRKIHQSSIRLSECVGACAVQLYKSLMLQLRRIARDVIDWNETVMIHLETVWG